MDQTAPRSPVRLALLHVLAPLALGAGIYGWARTALPALPRWVDHHLPDALWAYALCAALVLLWPPTYAGRAALAAGLLATAYECAQATPRVAGTFDPVDVGVQVAACLLAYLFLKNTRPIH